ncbi:MAG: class-III pyridoxal-phosphate-dependent aminotransferase [Candidatus Kariarchaeaceae archaeon]
MVQMKRWNTHDKKGIVITRGEGAYIWDDKDNKLLDLLSGTWCSILGHNHTRLTDRINSQSSKIIHVGAMFDCQEITEAYSKLQEIMPKKLSRVVFLNTGSEAVELALKMAHAATMKEGVIVCEKGYYGATTYSFSLSAVGQAIDYLPAVKNLYRFPAPHCKKCPVGKKWPCDNFPCLDNLREEIKEANNISAIIYEPIMGANLIALPPGFGKELRRLADELGAILIAEEVTTGIGRTGKWFGFEHDEIIPDILVIGKAIGAGLPISIVITSKEVEDRCQGKLKHVQSHQNDPFSSKLASEVITIIQQEKLIQKVVKLGDYFKKKLVNLQSESSLIEEVRGKGLMIGIELKEGLKKLGEEVAQQLLEKGFIVDYKPQLRLFRLYPPYILTFEEIDDFIEVFKKTLMENG